MTDNGTYAFENGHLEDEDVELLWQAIARAEALLEDLTAGQSTTAEFNALLDAAAYEAFIAEES